MVPATAEVGLQIVDVLVDGFLGTDPGCVAPCRAALGALGEMAVAPLQQAVKQRRRAFVQRERVSDLLHAISDGLYDGRRSEAEVISALIACLASSSTRLRRLSMEVIRRLPVDTTIEKLVKSASAAVSRPASCARLLRAAAELGSLPKGKAFFEALQLTAAGHKTVRQEAKRLVAATICR